MRRDPPQPSNPDRPTGSPKLAVLSLRGREVLLSSGKYFIGRSPTCHVVIDDARVSRRHARIDVYGEEVSITDLGSVNGIGLNGKRLPEGPHKLKHGDVIGIGREQLRLQIKEKARTDLRSRPPTIADAQAGSDPPVSGQEFEDEPATSTRLQKGVDLVFEVAEKALLAGDVAEAENVARDFLLNALAGATEGREATPGTYSLATTFGLRLARTTGKGEWFDYVVDMLRARRVLCSEDLAKRLSRTMEQVDAVDVARLEQYQKALRSGSTSMESLRAANVIGELLRAAIRKH